MRKAINENPIVQVGLIAVLGLLGVVMFMTRMGGDPAPAPADPAASAAAAAPAAGAVPVEAAPADAPPAEGATPVVPVGAAFEASPGLPRDVVAAHDSGDAVVLLVQQDTGIEDKKLRQNVQALEARNDTSVFIVDAKNVADYSRIAEGVNLDRIPAIVVIHPRDAKDAGSLPAATITYGFRGPDSIEQAVRDALYDGKQLPYHPG